MKKIAVIGASKGIGLACVNSCIERGIDVHALARTLPLPRNPGIKAFTGSAADTAIVTEVVSGVDAVILTIGTAITTGPVSVFSDSARAVTGALQKTNPGAFLVLVTGIGAGDSKGHGGFFYDKIILPLLLSTIYADKDRQEILVRNSGLKWTIVRPGFLTNGKSDGSVQSPHKHERCKSGRHFPRRLCAVPCQSGSRTNHAGQTVYIG